VDGATRSDIRPRSCPPGSSPGGRVPIGPPRWPEVPGLKLFLRIRCRLWRWAGSEGVRLCSGHTFDPRRLRPSGRPVPTLTMSRGAMTGPSRSAQHQSRSDSQEIRVATADVLAVELPQAPHLSGDPRARRSAAQRVTRDRPQRLTGSHEVRAIAGLCSAGTGDRGRDAGGGHAYDRPRSGRRGRACAGADPTRAMRARRSRDVERVPLELRPPRVDARGRRGVARA
jgi:hypothetical protein